MLPISLYPELARTFLRDLALPNLEIDESITVAVADALRCLHRLLTSACSLTEFLEHVIQALAPLPDEPRFVLLGALIEFAHAQAVGKQKTGKGRPKRHSDEEALIVSLVNMVRKMGCSTYESDSHQSAFKVAAGIYKKLIGGTVTTDAVRNIYTKQNKFLNLAKPGEYKGHLDTVLVTSMVDSMTAMMRFRVYDVRASDEPSVYELVARIYNDSFSKCVTSEEIEDAYCRPPNMSKRCR